MKGVIALFAAKYIQIGARVRYYRTIRELEQSALAEQLGITQQYMSKIERGTARPSTNLLFLIAKTLNVDVAELVKDGSEL